MRTDHLLTKAVTEKDFFSVFCEGIEDQSNPVFIVKGEINDANHVQNIIELDPDLIISYGCSIIKSKLLSVFKGRFINIHLGLSPYYKGSATNFWPFVYNEPQFAGVSFLKIDKGIDAAPIIHQIRPCFKEKDNIHDIQD